MTQKYGRKAEEILEKLEREEPSEKNFEMRAMALINMAGDRIMEMMGGEMNFYDDGRRAEYYRGRGRSGRGRSRYDGEDEREDMYYDGRGGRGRYDGRSGSGGRYDGGGSGGGRYDGERSGMYETQSGMPRGM